MSVMPFRDADCVEVCRLCGGNFTARALVQRAQEYWAEVDVVKTQRPCCSADEDLRLMNGALFRGYVYAAGQLHFSAEEEYRVPDLEVERTESNITVRLTGFERCVPTRR